MSASANPNAPRRTASSPCSATNWAIATSATGPTATATATSRKVCSTAYLTRNGYTPAQISSAIYKLRTEADNHSRSLYGNNQAVYQLLRYGVPVKIEAGKVTETVHLINWKEPEKNDFAIAEEVTLHGNHERRPDLVLYVNGIAIGVLELKNSRVSIGDGIRQNLSNQQPGVQRLVLQHGAVHLRRQRLRRACNTAPSARRRSIS